jgi:histidinol-phosphate aminotransferase
MLGEQATRQFMEQVPDDIIIVFDEAYVSMLKVQISLTVLLCAPGPQCYRQSDIFQNIWTGFSAGGYAMTTASIAQAIETVMEPFNVNGLPRQELWLPWLTKHM